MQRSIFAVLSALVVSPALVPAAGVQRAIEPLMTFNSTIANRASTSQLTPFNLAFLAYRGYLRNQGIPASNALLSALESGKVRDRDIVQSAVRANWLSEQILTDKSYLNALEEQLKTFETD